MCLDEVAHGFVKQPILPYAMATDEVVVAECDLQHRKCLIVRVNGLFIVTHLIVDDSNLRNRLGRLQAVLSKLAEFLPQHFAIVLVYPASKAGSMHAVNSGKEPGQTGKTLPCDAVGRSGPRAAR